MNQPRKYANSFALSVKNIYGRNERDSAYEKAVREERQKSLPWSNREKQRRTRSRSDRSSIVQKLKPRGIQKAKSAPPIMTLVSGVHPLEVELQIIAKMKDIAESRAVV